MARPKKPTKTSSLLEEVTEKNAEPKTDIDAMPLNNLADYLRYNEKARKLNKQLGLCRYKIKQCPEELHPKQRIQFMRKDQPKNPLPVFLSNELIEYKKDLIPGKTYDLPLCIIDYLAGKGYPIWEKVKLSDGSIDSAKTSIDPRFALRTVYAE
jgi:hypothetical protein